MRQKLTVSECRVCGCSEENPCLDTNESSCRNVQPIVQDECLFCTKPSLRTPPKTKIRIVGKATINKKYIYRKDTGYNHGYEVRVPIPELGKNKVGTDNCLTVWFSDNRTGSRGKSLQAAIKFREEALVEFNLSLEPKTKEISPDVNIYWSESHQTYTVIIKTKSETLSRTFSLKKWLTKENAHREARRWRDTVRADLDLPSAPGAFNTTVIQFEERKQEIIEHRSLIRASISDIIEQRKEEERQRQRVKPNHDGVSRHQVRQQAWTELVSTHGLHTNIKHRYKKRKK